MKGNIKRETLLHPLTQVVSVVERRQTLPILSNVLINATDSKLSFVTTDLEVEMQASCEAPVDQQGKTTIPARKLLDICKALPDGIDISFELKNNQFLLTTNNSKFKLSTLKASDFPMVDDFKQAHHFTMNEERLKRMIETTSFAMALQDVRYYLNGLYFEIMENAIRIVGTDGHRLAIADCNDNVTTSEQFNFILPRKAVFELQKLLSAGDNMITIQLGSNHMRFIKGDNIFTSKLIDGKYPDYEAVVPIDTDKELIIDKEMFREALQRTAILTNEKFRGVRLELDSNNSQVVAHNPEQEEAIERIEGSYQGKEVNIGFNVTYLLDAIAIMETDQVSLKMINSDKGCLLTEVGNTNMKQVVMPLKL